MVSMKLFIVSTYQKGDIIVYAKNKTDVKDLLEDMELTYYNIETLSKFCRDTYGDEATIVLE